MTDSFEWDGESESMSMQEYLQTSGDTIWESCGEIPIIEFDFENDTSDEYPMGGETPTIRGLDILFSIDED